MSSGNIFPYADTSDDLDSGFPINGSRILNYRVAASLNQHFILPRLTKRIPGIPDDLTVKSKLFSRSGSVSLRQLNLIHKNGTIKLRFKAKTLLLLTSKRCPMLKSFSS